MMDAVYLGGDQVDATPRILLVDDEADFRFSASIALRKAGFEVIEAEDGKEALSMIRNFRSDGRGIDLLLTDLRMPGLCGLELLEALGEDGIDIPVIAITGYGNDSLRADLEAKGCNEFMEKPFEPDDLVMRVRKVLDNCASGSKRE